MNCFTVIFSKFLITIVESHSDPFLRFQKLPWGNGKNILTGEYQKEATKYEGG